MSDLQQSTLFPRELVQAFARGDGTVFVGAGLSMGAGLPSWADLIAPFMKEIPDRPPLASFPQIAQLYENEHSRNNLISGLRKALRPAGARATSVHDALTSLPVKRIFTTNLDRLIESAFEAKGIPYHQVVEGPEISLMSAAELQIVKIHGDLDRASSIIITTGDYDDYLFGEKAAIADLLKVELQTRTILFLGYSFSDDNLRVVLSKISSEARQLMKNLYTIQFSASATAERELKRQGLSVLHLKMLSSVQETSESLATWLYQFAYEVEQYKRASSVSKAKAVRSENLPPRSKTVVGRDGDIEKVLQSICSGKRLTTIEGFGGVGKTTLALEAAYACLTPRLSSNGNAAEFEYIVWVSAANKPGQKKWLNEVLDTICKVTDYTSITNEKDLGTKETQVDVILEKHSTLIVLDNLETVDDSDLTAWINRASGFTKVLATTRQRQIHHENSIHLQGLDIDNAIVLLRNYASQVGIDADNLEFEERLKELALATDGNPQAMNLALRLVQGGDRDILDHIIKQLKGLSESGSANKIFDELFSQSWASLSEAARKILLVTPLFVGIRSIRKDALKCVAGLNHSTLDFDKGLSQLNRLGLLEQDRSISIQGRSSSRYSIHPLTRAFARSKLNENPQAELEARELCTQYYLHLTGESITRKRPETRYWNALVSDQMLDIDPEWPAIQEVIRWSEHQGDADTFLQFVMLLTHYMDSRFYNTERISFVRKAIEMLSNREERGDEALLRIDALGWTLIEENRFDEAKTEISLGLQIAEQADTDELDDLRALAHAWLARCSLEQNKVEEAAQLIHISLNHQCNPWIKCRIQMTAGDIFLRSGNPSEALSAYKSALNEVEHYGDEGHGYQTAPRIGFAYLAEGELSSAREEFERIKEFDHIPISSLYADYGLAMVAFAEGDRIKAQALISSIKEKLSRGGSSNLLSSLIEKLHHDLQRT